ncbi:hypothetical protein B0H12DRAFT_1233956 [Mycena haematopus]|nr:hypothetical protein B0H12DRAFT_1233956 [Mycena haematopus]
MNGFTTSTIYSLLSPEDKQDVLVANALQKALHDLPDAPLWGSGGEAKKAILASW